MLKIIRADNGMNIVGQGLKIILFTIPSAVLAIFLDARMHNLVRMPIPRSISIPLGLGLLTLGSALWAIAVIQLLVGFPQGKLVTTGAYGVCRNPIYSSFALFILPAISLLLGTWVYLCVSVFLCLGVSIFIRKEERELGVVFGNEYEAYKKRVNRILPFVKPGSR